MRISCALGVVLTSLVLGACGSVADPQAAPSKSEITTINKDVHAPIDGTDLLRTGMEMPGSDDFQAGVTQCLAADGLVKAGGQVTIHDAAGATIALGELGTGTLGEGAAPISSPCVFTTSIDDVPLGEKFYEVQVGDTTAITMTQDDLTDPSQVIDLE